MDEPIYLDYNATTPVHPSVVEAMLPALRDAWGNPSSAHPIGRRAKAMVEAARADVAALLGARDDEIVFTSGGTESDNAAILGVASALAERGRHVVISAVEHAAVDRACAVLEERGFAVTRVGVDRSGRVSPDAVADAVTGATTLVSLIHAQNETGVLQPVREVAERVRPRGVVLHTDAAQSVGKLPVSVDGLGADLLTVAGHKLYGPKGIGALYLRRGTPFVPLVTGASHESGRRAGTENVPGIVGLGAACRLAGAELPGRAKHLRALRDRLQGRIAERIDDLVVHGGEADRLPNTLSCAIPGVDAVELLARTPGIASAGGAACHSGQRHVSAVLAAMGVPRELALASVRLCVGSPTTERDVDRAAALLAESARALRA